MQVWFLRKLALKSVPLSLIGLRHGRRPAGSHVSHSTQRGFFGRLRAVKASAFERLEDLGSRKEPETAAIADDDSGLECQTGGRRSNFDDVIVEHKYFPHRCVYGAPRPSRFEFGKVQRRPAQQARIAAELRRQKKGE
jgi:hypothetical protein